MAQQIINDSPANSGLGDPLKVAFDKVNANFTEVYGNGALPGIFALGNQLPVAGSAMQIDNLFEVAVAAFPLKTEASIWPNNTYAFAGFSQTMTAGTVPAQGANGELVTLFAFANSNGATAPVTALLADAVARQSNSFVNGANIIARNGTGINGAKLVGLEIDVSAAPGTTINANSGGLFVNIFQTASSSPAIQINGVTGGSWQNGVVSNNVTGSHFVVQTGAPSSNYGLVLSTGTYSTVAIGLGQGASHGINFGNLGFGVTPQMWGDVSGNLLINLPSASTSFSVQFGAARTALQVIPVTNAVNFIQVLPSITGNATLIAATGSDANVNLCLFTKGTGLLQLNGSSSFTANGAVATTMTSLGPTGASTTVREWLTIINAAGAVRYIPCY